MEVTELCPHCDNEVTVMHDISKGYETICPECGKELLLCSECQGASDNRMYKCDWSEGNGCFRSKEANNENHD